MGFKAKHMDGTTYWHATAKDGLEECCGGTRTLQCFCGGDQCVCGNFGEVECPGCEDCGDMDEDDWELLEDEAWDDDDSDENEATP